MGAGTWVEVKHVATSAQPMLRRRGSKQTPVHFMDRVRANEPCCSVLCGFPLLHCAACTSLGGLCFTKGEEALQSLVCLPSKETETGTSNGHPKIDGVSHQQETSVTIH